MRERLCFGVVKTANLLKVATQVLPLAERSNALLQLFLRPILMIGLHAERWI